MHQAASLQFERVMDERQCRVTPGVAVLGEAEIGRVQAIARCDR